MPKLLPPWFWVAITGLCLLASPVAAQTLKWAPPPLVNPVTIPITPGAMQVSMRGNPDCILAWPKTKHVGYVQIFGCHNVVSIGGWNTIAQPADHSNAPTSRILEISWATGVVHIEGLLGDASAGGMSDGLVFNSPLATIQIENVRIDGIFGYSDQFHADCLQPFGGVKALRIYNFTCRTGYQGLSIWPVSTSPAGWTADIERTNITSFGTTVWGVHNDGGYIYWPCQDSACTNMALTSLTDVYLQPRSDAPFARTVYSTTVGALTHTPVVTATSPATISFPGLKVVGHVTQGPPPGGDFVPTGVAGPYYRSPGYAG
ncbi:MAG TPA: hypothetical protein VGI79_18145 [Caulobacteraceae bacterium]|jgi:hypothetical protein